MKVVARLTGDSIVIYIDWFICFCLGHRPGNVDTITTQNKVYSRSTWSQYHCPKCGRVNDF